jgi:hypothetical protein
MEICDACGLPKIVCVAWLRIERHLARLSTADLMKPANLRTMRLLISRNTGRGAYRCSRLSLPMMSDYD